jgi:hypothetical protein
MDARRLIAVLCATACGCGASATGRDAAAPGDTAPAVLDATRASVCADVPGGSVCVSAEPYYQEECCSPGHGCCFLWGETYRCMLPPCPIQCAQSWTSCPVGSWCQFSVGTVASSPLGDACLAQNFMDQTPDYCTDACPVERQCGATTCCGDGTSCAAPDCCVRRLLADGGIGDGATVDGPRSD